jgi:hypothetical protein
MKLRRRGEIGSFCPATKISHSSHQNAFEEYELLVCLGTTADFKLTQFVQSDHRSKADNVSQDETLS